MSSLRSVSIIRWLCWNCFLMSLKYKPYSAQWRQTVFITLTDLDVNVLFNQKDRFWSGMRHSSKDKAIWTQYRDRCYCILAAKYLLPDHQLVKGRLPARPPDFQTVCLIIVLLKDLDAHWAIRRNSGDIRPTSCPLELARAYPKRTDHLIIVLLKDIYRVACPTT